MENTERDVGGAMEKEKQSTERERSSGSPTVKEHERVEGSKRSFNRDQIEAIDVEEGEIEGVVEELPPKKTRGTAEELEDDGWTHTTRRQPSGSSSRRRRIASFFVYNIPDSIVDNDLRKIFNEQGNLIEAYIARRRDKYKNRFGFLRFNSDMEFPELLQSLQHKKCLGAILSVTPAKFDRRGNLLADYEKYGKSTARKVPHKQPSWQHQRRDIPLPSAFNPNKQPFKLNAQPNFSMSQQNPIYANQSFKDILLQHPNSQNSLNGSHHQINLPPNPFREFLSWHKAAIAITANSIQSMQDFYSFFSSTKPASATGIRYLGGLSLLITFSSTEGASDYYQSHKDIYSRSLKSFEILDNFMQDFGRIVKIKIFGVPLRFWDGEIFDCIAKKFGELVEPSRASINDINLLYSTALIKIKASTRLNCMAKINWKNISFDVRIDEVEQEYLPKFAIEENKLGGEESQAMKEVDCVFGSGLSAGSSPENNSGELSMEIESVEEQSVATSVLGKEKPLSNDGIRIPILETQRSKTMSQEALISHMQVAIDRPPFLGNRTTSSHEIISKASDRPSLGNEMALTVNNKEIYNQETTECNNFISREEQNYAASALGTHRSISVSQEAFISHMNVAIDSPPLHGKGTTFSADIISTASDSTPLANEKALSVNSIEAYNQKTEERNNILSRPLEAEPNCMPRNNSNPEGEASNVNRNKPCYTVHTDDSEVLEADINEEMQIESPKQAHNIFSNHQGNKSLIGITEGIIEADFVQSSKSPFQNMESPFQNLVHQNNSAFRDIFQASVKLHKVPAAQTKRRKPGKRILREQRTNEPVYYSDDGDFGYIKNVYV